jgi:hypothetical protein
VEALIGAPALPRRSRPSGKYHLIKEIGAYEGDARDRSFIFSESGHRLAGGAEGQQAENRNLFENFPVRAHPLFGRCV